MTRARPQQLAFTSGEITPRLHARADLTRYLSGLAQLQNFFILPQGGGTKRPGTRYVAGVKTHAKTVRVLPFVFSRTQAYAIEAGDGYFRFFQNRAAITDTSTVITGVTKANPGVVTAAAHGLSNGDRVLVVNVAGMVELNNREFTVANKTADTFELSGVDTSAYTAYTTGGTVARIYAITSPYAEADLADLYFAQSYDVLYLLSPDYPQKKLSRTGHTAWTIANITYTNGPFLDRNTTATTLQASAATGSGITITASAAVFEAGHVGALFKLAIPDVSAAATPWQSNTAYAAGKVTYFAGNYYSTAAGGTSGANAPVHEEGDAYDGSGGVKWTFVHKGWGVVRITAFGSSTSVTADVESTLPATCVSAATTKWSEGAWSDVRGYPDSMVFRGERAIYFKDQTIYGSVRGSLEDFEEGIDDDLAFVFVMASDQFNRITGGISGSNLIILTAAEEMLASTANGEPITPTNIDIVPKSTLGAAAVMPLRLGDRALFVNRTTNRLAEVSFSIESDSLVPADLTVIAEHITQAGITSLCWLDEPWRAVICLIADGTLGALTYMREENVLGWSRIATDGTIESIAAIPSPDGRTTDLWISVLRTIDSTDYRFMELLAPPYAPASDTDKAPMCYVDTSLEYDGSAADMISGLWHLNGEEVAILADGAVHPGRTVTNGQVTLKQPYSQVQIGLAYTALAETLDLDPHLQEGAVKARKRRITEVTLSVLNSLGGRVGRDLDHLKPIYFRTGAQPMDASPPLFTGEKTLDAQGDYGNAGKLFIVHDEPIAFTLRGIFPTLQIGD